MALIVSVSGIRGTLGGAPGQGLTPVDVTAFAAAYGRWVLERHPGHTPLVLLGQDARPSGGWLKGIAAHTLNAMGVATLDLTYITTPGMALRVVHERAQGAILFTASHNPIEWNGLKLFNELGELISADDGTRILGYYQTQDLHFATGAGIAEGRTVDTLTHPHLDTLLALPLVDAPAVAARGFRVLLDPINSVAKFELTALLDRLGVTYELINDRIGQGFDRTPEPLKENLTATSARVREGGFDLGIVSDPDGDRLVFIQEDGEVFGEEYTLVAVADYVLRHTPGPVVSNLSSSRALADLAARYGQRYEASAVGEVNVVLKMKEIGAVIGGEGNGGVIYPALHYGRDALVGTALFLSFLARTGGTVSELRRHYPAYEMVKLKFDLPPNRNVDALLAEVALRYAHERTNTIDGLKIDFADGWVHLRKSNTEPIIRLYAEGRSEAEARALALGVQDTLNAVLG
jgi:phosphomannomutase